METRWGVDFSFLTSELGSPAYSHLEWPVSKIHIAVSSALPPFYQGPWNSPLLHHCMSKMSVAWQKRLLGGGIGRAYLPRHVTGREMWFWGISAQYFQLLAVGVRVCGPRGLPRRSYVAHPSPRIGSSYLCILLYLWYGFTPSMFSINPARGFMYPLPVKRITPGSTKINQIPKLNKNTPEAWNRP